MLMKTHVLGGLAAGIGMAHITPHEPIYMVGAAMLGALIPDIDHAQSTLGRKIPLASKLIRGIFGHRTFTHSIAFVGGAAWLMSIMPIHPAIFWGFIFGIISHILLDAVTKDGVKLFWPLPITFRIPLYIRTGGVMEGVVAFILIILSIYWAAEFITL